MFKITVCHNEDNDLTIEEYLEIIEDHNLEVVSQSFDGEFGDTIMVIMGTKEDLMAWAEDLDGPGQSFNEDEFLDELIPA